MSRKSEGVFKFALGALVGVGVGMLFAPKSGEELRKDLKKKFNELIEKAKEIDIKEVSEDIKKRVADLKKEIEELDKEKVLAIAKEKGEQLKAKANELFELAKEKELQLLKRLLMM